MNDTQTLSIEERRARLMKVLEICGVPVEGVEFYQVNGNKEAIQLFFSDAVTNNDALAIRIKNGLNSLYPDLKCFALERQWNKWAYVIGREYSKGFEARVNEMIGGGQPLPTPQIDESKPSQAELEILKKLYECDIPALQVKIDSAGEIRVILSKGLEGMRCTELTKRLQSELARMSGGETVVTSRGYEVVIDRAYCEQFKNNLELELKAQEAKQLEAKDDELAGFIDALHAGNQSRDNEKLLINLKREGDGYSLNVSRVTGKKGKIETATEAQLVSALNAMLPALSLQEPAKVKKGSYQERVRQRVALTADHVAAIAEMGVEDFRKALLAEMKRQKQR